MRINPPLTSTPRRSVYLGQSRVGDVQAQERGYLARDQHGKPIGVFNSLREAANAVADMAVMDGGVS